MKLHSFQETLKTDIYGAFAEGAPTVLSVLPTGGGKTVIFASILAEQVKRWPVCAVAHRKELVGQISSALAREGLEHGIIGPASLVSYCRAKHLTEFGRPFINDAARAWVVSIDTLTSRRAALKNWAKTIGFWVQDEAHHMLPTNKWGAISEMMPKAFGLGVTATPFRADGQGLDGIFKALIEGPRMRELIDAGFLSEYRIACAPDTLIDISGVQKSKVTGDYAHNQLVLAVRKQTKLFGNVVKNFKRLASDRSAILFATDVKTAGDIAAEFRAAGIAAETLTAKSKAETRDATLAKFRDKKIQVICNVGLFDEGFDCPGVDAVLDAAPTCSLARFDQKFGRMLRVSPGKTDGLYIDFAGNVARHYPPDTDPDINPARAWTLAGREARDKPEEAVIPSRICPECTAPYARVYSACPHCGYAPTPANRSAPQFVDGDLTELDPSVLAAMRRQTVTDADAVGRRMETAGAERLAVLGATKRIRQRNLAHVDLGAAIESWGLQQAAAGIPASEAYKRFYFEHGTDVLTAQMLPKPDAEKLIGKLKS